MRVGLYLGDLRFCAWSHLPDYKLYGALSTEDLGAGLAHLLPKGQVEDPGVVRTARQGFILSTRTKRVLDEKACTALSTTVKEDLGVDPRMKEGEP